MGLSQSDTNYCDDAQTSYELEKRFSGLNLNDRARAHEYSSTTASRPPQAATTTGTLSTSSISLISHDHGRARREERGIGRRELQEAIKYGTKELANPGRDGQMRWRYTYKDVVRGTLSCLIDVYLIDV